MAKNLCLKRVHSTWGKDAGVHYLLTVKVLEMWRSIDIASHENGRMRSGNSQMELCFIDAAFGIDCNEVELFSIIKG